MPHVVQDVFLMGAPVPSDAAGWPWARARRVAAGRLVNAYTDAESDYVLALVSRVSVGAARSGTIGVAGLQPVAVAGVENVKIDGVEGHVAWRGLVGRCLAECDARGVCMDEVVEQEKTVAESIRLCSVTRIS